MPKLDDAAAGRLAAQEDAILAGLAELDAAEEAGNAVETTLETETVHVPPYGGRPGFSFPIRRLEPEGYDTLVKRHTRATKPGEPAQFRRQDFLCDVIVEATTDEAQAALWHNPARRKRYGCATPQDLVRKLIPKAGWRESVAMKVDELGGFGSGQRVGFGSSALEAADGELRDGLKA